MPIALIALTLSAFAIGTTEFVTVGLVPTISSDLNVSVPSTGLLVTMYAVGVAIGAPTLTALSSKYNKKAVLIAAMVVFSLGHIVSALSPNFITLLLARTITGLTHGLFFSIGATIATSLVPKEKEASAIAVMFGGLTVAMVIGVPLGTYIGQEFGWRNTFFIISLLGIIAFTSIIFLLPNNIKVNTPDKFFNQMKILANPKLIIAYLITIFGFGGPFIAFTFLVPILENITNFKSTVISLILLGFGVATIIGNYFGGKLADQFGVNKVLFIFFFGLSLSLLALNFYAQNQLITILILLFWGVFAFATTPGLQANVVKIATINEPHAVDVASGFNISAFNVGIALWSSIGGSIVANFGLIETTWIAAITVSMSLVLLYMGHKLENR